MNLSLAEENYLKIIYSLLAANSTEGTTTNEIAEKAQTKASSVSDMLKKLSEKQLIYYEKYRSVKLSDAGTFCALQVIRKHRLWEAFLHDKLDFSWDKVHEMAEQLEHIQSPELIDRLDAFLGHPGFDPHGDPIPDAKGLFQASDRRVLASLRPGDSAVIIAVKDSSTSFLQHLEKLGLSIGSHLTIEEKMDYDNSLSVRSSNSGLLNLSKKIAENLYVT